MAPLERLLPLAKARGIKIIEDAAQAIGARRKIDGEWRMAGELGWVTGYSFFPSKNLGAWGDGGMMVTSDDAAAERQEVATAWRRQAVSSRRSRDELAPGLTPGRYFTRQA